MNIHEEQLIRNFIVPPKRGRYLSMFESSKGRAKLIQNFYHLPDLDERFATKVEPDHQNAETILQLLKSMAAPDLCFAVSTNKKIDGRESHLWVVLDEIVGTCNDGTFISCIPGKLGYYEGEDPENRFIFKKK